MDIQRDINWSADWSNSFSLILVLNVLNAYVKAFLGLFPSILFMSNSHPVSSSLHVEPRLIFTRRPNNVLLILALPLIKPRCVRFHISSEPHQGCLEAIQTTSPAWSRPDCLVRSWVGWFVFTLAQKVRTRDFCGWVRIKQGRCE